MLSRLSIKNFALIDNLEVDFSAGLNVLTGETGAGKSIIIDAMGIIIGRAALQDYIRTGEERALVEALFDTDQDLLVYGKLRELGLDSEDENLLLTREIQRNGKNICRVNGRVVTLSMYREIGELLVDIYGQNQQQSLLNKEKHLLLLDSFGGEQIKAQLDQLSTIVKAYKDINRTLATLKTDEAEKARRQDLYNFQLQEIEEAGLLPEEEDLLIEEKNIIGNAEKINELAQTAYELIYRGNSGQLSAVELLYKAHSELKDLSRIDPSMESLANQLQESLIQIEDCAREVGRYSESISFDPDRLNQVISRLEKIKQLKRKYGSTITEILKYRTEIAAALDQLTNSEEEMEKLAQELQNLLASYNQLANQISDTRQGVAQKIEQEICHELADLCIPDVTFQVSFKERKEVATIGKDDVEFLISPNPGEPLKPLNKIASGGEVSRIMLAMKTILAKVDEIPTLIFDEIDSGLGGKAIQSVAQKLARIGRTRQVICVTHSPQLASYGDNHFNICKSSRENRTVTNIMNLSNEDRIQELARMLGGTQQTDNLLSMAAEMLEIANRVKTSC